MKKFQLLIVVVLVLNTISEAVADTCSTKLMSFFTAAQAAKVCGSWGDGNFILDNNTFLSGRNAANNANISILKIDATDDTVVNADSGDLIKLSVAGVSEMQVGDDVFAFTGTSPFLGKVSAAGDLTIGGGIANSAASGSRVYLESKTATGTGDLEISTSDGANADAVVGLNGAGSDFIVNNLSGSALLTLTQAGASTFAAGITATTGNVTSTAGDFVATTAGKGVKLKSPDGSCSYCTVDNSDVFSCASTSC